MADRRHQVGLRGVAARGLGPARRRSGRRLPGARAPPSGRNQSRLMHLHTPPRGFLSHVRYQFVDCRWSLDDPGLGRRLYLEAHIPGAAFLDVERDLSAPAGSAGRHPLPAAGASSPRPPRAAGIGAGRSGRRLRHARRSRAPLVAAAPLRPRRVRRDRPRGVARAAARRRGGDRAAGIRPGRAGRRHDRAWTSSRRAGRSSSSSMRALPARWRGEPNPVDRVPGRIPGALNAPWNEELPALPGGRARHVLRLGRHRVRRCCTGSTSPGGRAASTRARGRSGSSIRNCRSSVLRR